MEPSLVWRRGPGLFSHNEDLDYRYRLSTHATGYSSRCGAGGAQVCFHNALSPFTSSGSRPVHGAHGSRKALAVSRSHSAQGEIEVRVGNIFTFWLACGRCERVVRAPACLHARADGAPHPVGPPAWTGYVPVRYSFCVRPLEDGAGGRRLAKPK